MGNKIRSLLLVISVALFSFFLYRNYALNIKKVQAVPGTLQFGSQAATSIQTIVQKTTYSDDMYFGSQNNAGTLGSDGTIRVGQPTAVGVTTAPLPAGFKIDANGRTKTTGVSIGTTASTSTLEVTGNTANAANLQGNVGIGNGVTAPFTVPLNIYDPSSANLIKMASGGNVVNLGANATALTLDKAVQSTGNGTSYFSGSVGIGTSSPQGLLDVRGTTPAITVANSSAQEGALYLGNSAHGIKRNYGGTANDVGLYTTSGTLFLSANGTVTNQVALTNGGYVGIGTSSPVKALDVRGSANFGQPGYDTGAIVNIGTTTSDYPGSSGWAGSWNSNIVLTGLDNSSISFHDSAARVDTLRVGGGQFNIGENVGWGVANTRMYGSGFVDGNLGVGTTSPGAKLEVNGGINIAAGNTISGKTGRIIMAAENTANVAQFASYGMYLPQYTSYNLYAGGGITTGYSGNAYSNNFPNTTYMGQAVITSLISSQSYGWDWGQGYIFYLDGTPLYRFSCAGGMGSGSVNFVEGMYAGNEGQISEVFFDGSQCGASAYQLLIHNSTYNGNAADAFYFPDGVSHYLYPGQSIKLTYRQGKWRPYDGAQMTLNYRNGNIGIGTYFPQQKLEVAGTVSSSQLYALASNGTSYFGATDWSRMAIHPAVNDTYNPVGGTADKAHFHLTLDQVPAGKTGLVEFNSDIWATGGSRVMAYQFWRSCNGTCSLVDLAESYSASEMTNYGDILMNNPENPSQLSLADKDHRNSLTGVVTTYPNDIYYNGSTAGASGQGNKWSGVSGGGDFTITSKETYLALAGRTQVKISTLSGPVKKGDRITISNLKGIGEKATTAGMTVGQALQDFNTNSCTPVQDVQSIQWRRDVNDLQSYPCYRLADGTFVGKIMMFISTTWYDPDVYLTDSGTLHIGQDAQGQFNLKKDNTGLVERLGAFAKVVVAKIEAGLIETKQLVVNGVDILKKLNETEAKLNATEAKLNETRTKVEAQGQQIEQLKLQLQKLAK